MKIPNWWWLVFLTLAAIYVTSAALALRSTREIWLQSSDSFDLASATLDHDPNAIVGQQLNASKRTMELAKVSGIWLVPSLSLFLFLVVSLALLVARANKSTKASTASPGS